VVGLAKVEEAENNAVMQKDLDEALVKLHEKHAQEGSAFEDEATRDRQSRLQNRAIYPRPFETRHAERKPLPPGEFRSDHDASRTYQVVRLEGHSNHGYRYPRSGRFAQTAKPKRAPGCLEETPK
jgi:hypothetical protein